MRLMHFQRGLTEVGRCTLNVGGTMPWDGGTQLNKEEEASEHHHPSLLLPKYGCDMTSHPILLPP